METTALTPETKQQAATQTQMLCACALHSNLESRHMSFWPAQGCTAPTAPTAPAHRNACHRSADCNTQRSLNSTAAVL